MKRKRFEKGFSLIEVMVASTVLAGVVGSAMTMQNMTFNRTIATNDKAFATQKAMQMFEELRAYVQANRESDIAKLQNYSDGSSFNHVLTTEKRELTSSTGNTIYDLTNPADPLSGNMKVAGSSNWKFVRQVQIKPVANDANARYVSVAVWYADETNNTQPKGSTDRPLAVISGILKTNITQEPPTQMYDLFVIAMENAPSWWVDQADLRPSFERTLLDLESRNPGLIFRRHFITRPGFGRDPYYLPYINDGDTVDAQDAPWTYLYPGRVDNNLNQNYLIDVWKGRRRTDDINSYRTDVSSTFKTLNKLKPGNSGEGFMHYAVADQFNHVMRYPEQRAMENRLRAEYPAVYKDSPSLITFLEEMNSGLNKNSMIINLHGELLPLPALRNYSDPAKAPDRHARKLTGDQMAAVITPTTPLTITNDDNFVSLMNKRVVSHPENLQASNGSTVSWRVYPFEEYAPGSAGLADDNAVATASATRITRDNNSIPKISLFIPTIGTGPNYNGNGNGFLDYPDFTPGSVTGLSIERLVGGRVGGTDQAGFQPYAWWTNGSTGFRAITDTHNPASGNARVLVTPAQIIDRINGTVLGSVVYPVTVNNLRFTTNIGGSNADRNDMRGMLAVVGFNTTVGTRIARILNVTGNNTLNFTTPFTINSAADLAEIEALAITRHKDYDATVVDKNMYGQPHRGIHITLYDTPTRNNCYNNTDCGDGTASGGVRSDRRLDGLEYVPAPINTTWPSSGATTYSLVDNSTSNWKNSARWRVNLDTSTYGNNFDNQMLTLETRMVTASDSAIPATTYPPRALADADNDNDGVYDPCEIRTNPVAGDEAVLCDGIWGDGDVYVPNDPDTVSISEHNTTVRPNIYNVSRTYTYMNHMFTEAQGTVIAASVTSNIPAGTLTIPRAEQAQFQGHPLYNPYLDVKQLNRYNRHFVSGINGSQGRAGFGSASGTDWNVVNVDLNWFFQLYTNGLMRSNSIYNSISGYSNYYYAFGGEIGSDNTNNNRFFDMRTQPWSETDTGTATARNDSGTVRDIIHDSSGGERVIMSTDGTTSGGANDRWRMRHHLGQLYPDQEHAFWLANGNLPTLDYNNTNHNADANANYNPTATRYFRARSDANPRGIGYTTHRRMQGEGAPTFMNGNIANNPTTSDAGLAHSSTGGNGILTNAAATDAGSQLMNAYNLTLSDQIASNRPYRLDGGTVAGPYTSPEMRGIRNRLAFVNTTTGITSGTNTTQNVYYRHQNSPTTLTSSSFVKLTRPNPTALTTDLPGLAGYMLVNGFAQATGSGTQEIARFSLAASLQTFMDAGDRSVPGAASGRTVQLPRVRVDEPRSSQIYVDPATIGVQANVAWMRWDDRRYSPAYPANWRDNTPLLYNVKYSTNNKKDWLYADDHSAVTEQYKETFNIAHSVMGGPETTSANDWNKTFTWNVSTLPEGNYVLRVEVYRQDFSTGYSYHDVFVTIER